MKLLAAIQRRSVAPAAAPGDRVTHEIVETVDAMDRATLKNLPGTFTCTGRYRPRPGDVVPLLWQHGRPLVIVQHRVRRSLNTADDPQDVAGIVEQLLVYQPPPVGGVAQPTDVYYRNHAQCAPLNVPPYLKGQTPVDVKWGADGNSFGVACSGGFYAVFAFTRTDPDVYSDDNPGFITLLYYGKPMTTNTPLVTVSFFNERKTTVKYWAIKVQTVYQWIQWRVWYAYAAFCWAWKISDNVQVTHGWEASGEAVATAFATTAETFGIQDALRGKTDQFGTGTFKGSVLEWVVDADRRLKFVVSAEWDNYRGRNAASASGTAQVPWGAGPNGMSPWTIQASAGAAISVVGGRKWSDKSYIPEKHVFLIDGQTDAVLWGSAPPSVSLGWKGNTVSGFMRGHYLSHTPAEPSGSPGTPSCVGSYLDPNPTLEPEQNSESYYAGANWSNWPAGSYKQNAGNIGDERIYVSTSTGTFQLIDPARLQCLRGPYKTDAGSGEYTRGMSILLPWPWGAGNYMVTFSTTQGSVSALWFHRVAYAKAFTQQNRVRLFVVVERYPFVSGTGYVNDIPQLWIGVLDLGGAVVTTLRDWQYGLGGAQLLDANDYHLLWMLSTGWIQSRGRVVLTNLHVPHAEVTLTPEQYAAIHGRGLKLYAPDFVYTEADNGTFVGADPLQAQREIHDLKEYASLANLGQTAGQTQAVVAGKNRIINDVTILKPLGLYLAA